MIRTAALLFASVWWALLPTNAALAASAAGLAGGNFGNNTTSVTRSMGSVTAGQLVVVYGMKFSPTADAFVAGDVTKSAGTATIGTVSLDRTNGGDDGTATAYAYAGIWSAIVTGSGTLTMQVGGAAAGSYILIAAEAFNGSWDASRVEAVNGSLVTTNSTSSTSTGNVTSAGAAVMAAAIQLNTNAATTITPDAAFTTVYENETGTDDNGSAIYRIVGSGTTDAGDWTHGTNHNGTASAIVAYKEVAGSSSVRVNPLTGIGGAAARPLAN